MGGAPFKSLEWTDIASAWSDMIMALLTTFTLLGVVYVAWQVNLQRTQLHRDLENLYLERYWTIRDRLDASVPQSEERERAVLAYLRLSEDQCDQRANERVTDPTWKIWEESIHSALSEVEYSEVLDSQPQVELLHLREMRVTTGPYDPSGLTRRQKAQRGLAPTKRRK